MGAPHGRVSFPGRNFYAECGRMLRRQRGEEGRGSTPQAEGTDSAKALGAGRISQTGCWLVLPRDSPHRSIFQAGLQTEGEENSPGTLPGRSSSPACSPGPLMVRPATVPPGGSPCVRLGFPATDGPHLAREGQEAGPKKSPGVVCSHRGVMAPGLRSAAHARGQGEGSRAAVRGGWCMSDSAHLAQPKLLTEDPNKLTPASVSERASHAPLTPLALQPHRALS